MGKREEISNTQILVKRLLTECPETRNSDMILYIKVVEKLNSACNSMAFESVLRNLKELGLPCFETVRRTRAKIQSEYPELKGCKAVQEGRAENEEIFEEYARS